MISFFKLQLLVQGGIDSGDFICFILFKRDREMSASVRMQAQKVLDE